MRRAASRASQSISCCGGRSRAGRSAFSARIASFNAWTFVTRLPCRLSVSAPRSRQARIERYINNVHFLGAPGLPRSRGAGFGPRFFGASCAFSNSSASAIARMLIPRLAATARMDTTVGAPRFLLTWFSNAFIASIRRSIAKTSRHDTSALPIKFEDRRKSAEDVILPVVAASETLLVYLSQNSWLSSVFTWQP